jgi:hypothetical protein
MAISPVNIPISATDKFSKTFGKAQGGLAKLGKAAAQTATKVAKIGAAFAAAGAAAGIALTKASMQSIDALAKTADRIGITTESLRSLQMSAALAGVENKTLEKSLQNLAVGVSDAADGTGIAKDAFIELGLSAQRLEKLPLDQQMFLVADAMKNVENQTDKVRIATDLFGARGVAVLNMIGGGSENLKLMAEETEKLGLAISRVDAAKIEQANDAVTQAKGVFEGIGNQLAVSFSPLIKEAADNFRQAALDTEGFGSIGQRVAQAVVSAFGKVGDVLHNLVLGFAFIKRSMLEVVQTIMQKLNPAFVSFSNLYNTIAGVFNMDLIPSDALARAAMDVGNSIMEVNDQIATMTNAPLPSERFQAFFEEIQAGARKAAEAIADAAPGKVIAESTSQGTEEAVKKLSFFEEQAIAGEKKRKEFIMKSTTAQTSHVLGELNNQFAGVASNNKKLFALNKAFQIAQAIMQTYQGATLAISSYPPPLNFAMAAATVAAGLGQVAQIKAQSFEGGGFTGVGSRSGGIDGRGGFPAILHKNETVIDHTKGQGQGITIINNVDARGSGPEVDIKIQQAMQVTSQQTIATIQDLMRRRRFA